ncbi:tetratricopeptide repeat protein [Petropleomorpha daqingensis]|uniref:Tetratricopeptide (TPR) repeat protein n=1 Tax=Petropleomorpha daqingensis TaxID=2026353 RepID=A0A853C9N1_9ACTN|nr:tetratricopeptide (TPR) repeat protein [Petropleomorpha daqingensis]
MRGPVGDDDLEKWESSAQTPEDHRTAAATLLAWADEPHPEDDVPPARLLSSAAWHLETAGDAEDALDLHRRAVEAPGEVVPDARCYLHGALLESGRVDEARELANEIRREAPADTDVYLVLGENYALAGDLTQAHRWLTMGAERLERTDRPINGIGVFHLLRARRRVRDSLGLPFDDLDALVPPIAQTQSEG